LVCLSQYSWGWRGWGISALVDLEIVPHQQLSQSRFNLARLGDAHDQVLRGALDLLCLVELALRLTHLGIEATVKHPQN
jgi:hypothetical protein